VGANSNDKTDGFFFYFSHFKILFLIKKKQNPESHKKEVMGPGMSVVALFIVSYDLTWVYFIVARSRLPLSHPFC
jgi:hypothetical protein